MIDKEVQSAVDIIAQAILHELTTMRTRGDSAHDGSRKSARG